MKTPTARKLPSGAWNIQVMVDGKRKSITAGTEKECLALALQYKAGLKDAEDPARMNLGDCIDKYIESRTLLSPSTIRGYKSVRNHRFQRYMQTPIRRIDKAFAQRMVNEEAKEVSVKTLRNSWGLVTSSLAEEGIHLDIVLPAKERTERPYLDFEQIGIFLHAIDGKDFSVAAMLALMGLRRSEIFAVTWKDVDLKHRTITVSGAYVASEDGFVYKKSNKTASSSRVVPILIPQLYDELCAVENKEGKLVNTFPDTLRKQIQRTCKREGLGDNIGCHSLRHSFASICYHLKVSEHTCARWGGWSDLQTMNNIYTHLAAKDLEKDALNVQSYFANL